MVNPYMSIWVSLKCCSTSSYHWPLADLLTHPIDVSSLGVCCTDKGSHAGATHHVYRYTYKKSIHEWDTSDVNSRFTIFGYCNCLWSQGIESQNIGRKEIKAVTERMHNLLLVAQSLYTLASVCIFSILFSIHFLRRWQGELFNNRKLIKMLIISFILVTWKCDSGVTKYPTTKLSKAYRNSQRNIFHTFHDAFSNLKGFLIEGRERYCSFCHNWAQSLSSLI